MIVGGGGDVEGKMVMSTVQSALDLCIYAGRYSLCLHPLNARR